MKQKIVIMVCMPCAKCRAKAMELAAKANGVISVAITGESQDQLEVVGDGIDLVCLVSCLRKKVGRAVVLLVEEVKAEKQAKENPEVKKLEVKNPLPQCYPGCYCCPPVPVPVPQVVVYEDSAPGCSII